MSIKVIKKAPIQITRSGPIVRLFVEAEEWAGEYDFIYDEYYGWILNSGLDNKKLNESLTKIFPDLTSDNIDILSGYIRTMCAMSLDRVQSVINDYDEKENGLLMMSNRGDR